MLGAVAGDITERYYGTISAWMCLLGYLLQKAGCLIHDM